MQREAWVGRREELEVLRSALTRLGRGEGSSLWIEGEPGVGKSSLAAVGRLEAAQAGYKVYSAAADQLSQQASLSVMMTCLGVRRRSPDPRRAEIAQYLYERRPDPPADDAATGAVVADMLVWLVEELCDAAPSVIVVDDIQWADDASRTVWHRLALAAQRLPLVLIGICSLRDGDANSPRPRSVSETITLAPLPENDALTLVQCIAGGTPGPALSRWAGAAMGNPLYLHEIIDALLRENLIHIEAGVAEMKGEASDGQVPAPLAEVLNGRLRLVTAQTREVLKAACLLGGDFAVTDLALILGQEVPAIFPSLSDAMTAGILVCSGKRMAFRHSLLRQAMYDTIPASVRTGLHQHAARALAKGEADALSVAQQLIAAGEPEADWISDWLLSAAQDLAVQAPEIAERLFSHQLQRSTKDNPSRSKLTAVLAHTMLRAGRYEQAERYAREALALTGEPGARSEMFWLMNRALIGANRMPEAAEVIQEALTERGQPTVWRARLLASLAMVQRAGGVSDVSSSTASRALIDAEQSGDRFAIAYSLINLWMTLSVQRSHSAALEHIDRAIDILGTGRDQPDLLLFALHSKVFNLQNLCRWAEAEAAMRHTKEVSRNAAVARGASGGVTEAVLLYWLGNWDGALAALGGEDESADGSYAGLRERGPDLLWHGVAALIAGRRADLPTVQRHLRSAASIPIVTRAERENADFLFAAEAAAAEQQGNFKQAVAALSRVVDRRPGEMTLVHQWMADLVRVGVAANDRRAVKSAMAAARAEAAAESCAGRAAAMLLRSEGLAFSDPGRLREAVTFYREKGPQVELAAALEDLAVVLAENQQAAASRVALGEATKHYEAFGAAWDLRRATSRLRRYGIRRGVPGIHRSHGLSGWQALTPT